MFNSVQKILDTFTLLRKPIVMFENASTKVVKVRVTSKRTSVYNAQCVSANVKKSYH